MELPNLRKQPSYNTILRALLALKIEPATWNATNISSESDDQVAALRFLNSIISSDLDWLNDLSFYNGTALSYVDQKDMLLGLASKRMAERCGRTGIHPSLNSTSLAGRVILVSYYVLVLVHVCPAVSTTQSEDFILLIHELILTSETSSNA
jgi:hypothetical protein